MMKKNVAIEMRHQSTFVNKSGLQVSLSERVQNVEAWARSEPTICDEGPVIKTLEQLKRDFIKAMETPNSGLNFVYQPKFKDDGTIVGVEALIRWQHEIVGAITPAVILKVVDLFHLETLFMRFSLQSISQDWEHWHKVYGLRIPVAINIDPCYFLRNQISKAQIMKLIRDVPMDLKYLEVELTEHTMLGKTHEFGEVMYQLKSEGITLAIDDFGMGYTSLNYMLKDYIDVLKVDRVLIEGIDKSTKKQNIVKCILDLAHSCQIDTVVEGVETMKEAEVLKRLGAHVFQGFFYSKPMTVEELMTLFSSEHFSDWRRT